MHCSLSEGYLQNAGCPSDVAKLQEDAVQDIIRTFNIPATYGVPNTGLAAARYSPNPKLQKTYFVYDIKTRGGYFLNPPQRVFVLNHENWVLNRNLTVSPGYRGVYHSRPAAILLHENGDNKNSWCKKTLLHETLHSVSLYSRIWDRFPNLMRLHKPIIEGITECLTGYILLHEHPHCYRKWKSNKMDRCKISYQPNVKLWCSFCQIVGISDLAKFYLSSGENPTDVWNQFVKSINTKGFGTFNYQLDFTKAFRETEFRQVCVNALPNFRETYESLTKSLDFSSIP